MSALSNYQENLLADHLIGKNTTMTVPSTLYFALFKSPCSDATTGSEVTGAGYARVAVDNTTANFNAAVDGKKSNKTDVIFPTAGAAGWGNIVSWAIMDAASNGQHLYYGSLTTQRSIVEGDTPKFPAGQFELTFD